MKDFARTGAFPILKSTYTYGTAIAHVAVDPETGHVEVVDYLVVDDVGRIINPITLHGQVIGAAVQGLGSVSPKEILYDRNGQLLVGSLADYLIPVATDYTHLHAVSLEALLPFAEQSARRQRRWRRRHHPVGRCLEQRRRGALRGFGVERAAVDAAKAMAAHSGRSSL